MKNSPPRFCSCLPHAHTGLLSWRKRMPLMLLSGQTLRTQRFNFVNVSTYWSELVAEPCCKRPQTVFHLCPKTVIVAMGLLTEGCRLNFFYCTNFDGRYIPLTVSLSQCQNGGPMFHHLWLSSQKNISLIIVALQKFCSNDFLGFLCSSVYIFGTHWAQTLL